MTVALLNGGTRLLHNKLIVIAHASTQNTNTGTQTQTQAHTHKHIHHTKLLTQCVQTQT